MINKSINLSLRILILQPLQV